MSHAVSRWRDNDFKISPTLCLWALFNKLSLQFGCYICLGTFRLTEARRSESIGEYASNMSFFILSSTLVVCNFALLGCSQLLTNILLTLDKLLVEVRCHLPSGSCYKDAYQWLNMGVWLMTLGVETHMMCKSQYNIALKIFLSIHVAMLSFATIHTIALV